LQKQKIKKMATIEIIIKDDNGNIINQDKSLIYNLDLNKKRFTDIEGAVDIFKKLSSNEITKFLLEQMQKDFIVEKKTTLISY